MLIKDRGSLRVRRILGVADWPSLIAVAAGIVFIVSFVLQVQRNPLRADEVDYFQCMANNAALGMPLYYAGEVELEPTSLIHLGARELAGRRFDFYRTKPETGILKESFFAITDGNSRYTYCLWHPPLYVSLGSLVFRLTALRPPDAAALRYFNLIFGLCVFAGMACLAREAYRPGWRWACALALALYAANSLSVRAALLIDYNATLGPAVAVWFAVACLRSERRKRISLSLAAMTALALATGLGIGASLIVTAGVCALLSRRRCAPAPRIAALAAGVVLFAASFWAFCRVAGLPFSQPFLHNLQRVDQGWAPDAPRFLLWYCASAGALTMAAALVLWLRLSASGRDAAARRRQLLPLAVLVGFASQASLGADAYGFPKYIAFVLPLLFAFLGGEIAALLSGAAGARWRRIALVALTVIMTAQIWHSVQVFQRPGGALYFAGEQGFLAIAEETARASGAGATIMSPKDIAFYADRRFVQWHGLLLTDGELLRRRLSQEQVTHLAASRSLLDSLSAEVAGVVHRCTTAATVAGDFTLLATAGLSTADGCGANAR